jgi:hypothetical protein
MNRVLCFLLAGTLCASPAWANFDVTTGSGTHIFAIDAANQGTSLCAATSTECWGMVPVDTTGTPLGTTGNPLHDAVTGTFWQTTQPVSGTVTANAGTNLNTSALATDAHLTALTTVMGSPMQTTGGTVGLAAGSTIVGKVGIDQTTPGTTNAVSLQSCAVGICGLPTVTSNALVKGTTAAMTGTTSTQVVAAVTSQRIYVNSIHCNNSSATATLVAIQDGSGGTTLDTLAAGATYGGDNRNGGSVPLFWTTAGNGLYAADVTTGASVICQASGFSNAN